jgi:uncharacterized membrane protein YfcA
VAAVQAAIGSSPITLVYVALAIFIAFAVRGFSGFGSSLIAVSALTIVLAPALVVPAIFALEVLASISLLPAVWQEIDWRSLRWVIAGCAIATPIGVLALAEAPVDLMRLAISALVVCAAIVLLTERTLQRSPAPWMTFGVGCAVGILNGASGMGGPPAVIFYFATVAASVGRATLIAFFVFTDLYALLLASTGGLLTTGVIVLAIYAVPFVLLGIWFGNKGFIRTNPKSFRKLVLWLLIVLGLAGVISAATRA